jgi:hypothetical protein
VCVCVCVCVETRVALCPENLRSPHMTLAEKFRALDVFSKASEPDVVQLKTKMGGAGESPRLRHASRPPGSPAADTSSSPSRAVAAAPCLCVSCGDAHSALFR